MRTLAILLLGMSTAAHADVQSHVDRATELHARGKLPEALRELATAYTLDPKPELLYGMAQIHVRLDNCAQAVPLYERFLAAKPAPAQQAAATEAIAHCKSRHVERATKLHGDGKFAAALAELEQAYVDDPQPALLYAIAQVHVKLADCAGAIPYYERYLATHPKAKSEAAAKEAIETCRIAPAPEPTKAEVPRIVEAAPPPTTRRPAWYRDVAFDAFAGSGAVLAIAGVVTYAVARGNLDDANAATDPDRHDTLLRRGHRDKMFAIGFGAGAVALGGAAVYRYFHPSSRLEVGAPAGGEAGAVVGWATSW